MSLSKQFKTDANLERDGVGVQFPANEDGSIPEIFIARAGRSNTNYQRVLERVMKPFRRAASMNVLPAIKQEELTREIFAEAGITGWKNIAMADVTGDPIDTGMAEYTKDNAVKLLTQLPDLYSTLIELSVDRATFLAGNDEEDAKNSARSSASGSSRGR